LTRRNDDFDQNEPVVTVEYSYHEFLACFACFVFFKLLFLFGKEKIYIYVNVYGIYLFIFFKKKIKIKKKQIIFFSLFSKTSILLRPLNKETQNDEHMLFIYITFPLFFSLYQVW
jgi:hypothetical protein